MTKSDRFWEQKALNEMTRAEWESLCDGCGKCCLHKLEDEDTGDILYTDIACELLDRDNCRCQDYPNRKQKIPDCLLLTASAVASCDWLPSTCGYRLISEDKPLAYWHPLISGSQESVHKAGISVSGRVLSASHIHPDDYEERIVHWVE